MQRAGYALYPESDTIYREAQVVAAGQAPPPVILNGPEFVRMARVCTRGGPGVRP